jgi:putative tryptophan/tyrosine transport system substrate-binding protein
MMKRRKLMALFLVAGLPFSALAQPAKVWRLGILSIKSRPRSLDDDLQFGPFLRGLRELGYEEGKNLTIEGRFAHGDYELLPGLAAELVRLNVDVIAAHNAPVIRAAQRATTTIPIVMLTSSDPVGSGFVASLARPGGNITGPSNINADLSSKYVELLTILSPRLSSVAFLFNPENRANRIASERIEVAARKRDILVLRVEAKTSSQLYTALSSAAQEKPDGMIVALDARFIELRQTIVDLTLKYRIPSLFPNRWFVDVGGLMSYGQDFTENSRHAATYVDRIFRGAKPADLPVETATRLELVINRKTARTLGLSFPQELLLRADAVID